MENLNEVTTNDETIEIDKKAEAKKKKSEANRKYREKQKAKKQDEKIKITGDESLDIETAEADARDMVTEKYNEMSRREIKQLKKPVNKIKVKEPIQEPEPEPEVTEDDINAYIKSMLPPPPNPFTHHYTKEEPKSYKIAEVKESGEVAKITEVKEPKTEVVEKKPWLTDEQYNKMIDNFNTILIPLFGTIALAYFSKNGEKPATLPAVTKTQQPGTSGNGGQQSNAAINLLKSLQQAQQSKNSGNSSNSLESQLLQQSQQQLIL
jgi:hypothetical protein